MRASRPAMLVVTWVALAACARHVTPCDAGDDRPTRFEWEREEDAGSCITAPDLHARWWIEREGDRRTLRHEDVAGGAWSVPLDGFDFLLGRRLDDAVVVVQWVDMGPFVGLRITIVDAHGAIVRTVDEPDDGTAWMPVGLAVAADGSFLVARLLLDDPRSTLTRHGPDGERRWRLFEPGMIDAPLVDGRDVAYVREVSHDPTGASIFAVDAGGVVLWRHALPFNHAASPLGVLPDGSFVYQSARAVLHTPTNEAGERYYYPFVEPELCTILRDGTPGPCRPLDLRGEAEALPPTVPRDHDGSHRIP